jgi:hypothetical protein
VLRKVREPMRGPIDAQPSAFLWRMNHLKHDDWRGYISVVSLSKLADAYQLGGLASGETGRILVQRPDLYCEHNQWQESQRVKYLCPSFSLSEHSRLQICVHCPSQLCYSIFFVHLHPSLHSAAFVLLLTVHAQFFTWPTSQKQSPHHISPGGCHPRTSSLLPGLLAAVTSIKDTPLLHSVFPSVADCVAAVTLRKHGKPIPWSPTQ